MLVYSSWQILRWPASAQTLIGNFSFYPVEAAAVLYAWGASRRVSHVPRLRRAWLLISLGGIAYLLGDVAYAMYDLLGVAPYPSVADSLYLAFYPLLLGGLLSFPTARRTRRDSVRLSMDIAVVAIAFSAAVFYLTLGPNLHAAGDPLQKAFSVAYPVGDLVLLVALSAALINGAAGSIRLPLRLIGTGIGLYVVGDLIYGYQTLHAGYRSGDPVDLSWFVALALFAVAAATQPALAVPEPVARANERIGRLPFIGVAFGFGALLFSQRNNGFFPEQLMTLIAMTLAGLLAMRLYLGQRDLLSAQGEINHRALHDDLTGLANRVLLLDRIDHSLRRAARNSQDVAVMLLDADDFKLVNDSLGHAAGDELLIELAERLQRVARAGETVAHLGGDEFVLAAEGTFDEREIAALAGRVLSVFAEPFVVGQTERRLSGSLGIAKGRPGDGVTAIELIRDADTAMYRAKTSGKARFDIFDTQLRNELLRHVELGAALELAIRSARLEVAYQPIVNVNGRRLLAAEALVRWTDEHFGEVSPSEFIPLAEESGLIVPLGRFVIESAAGQIAEWRRQAPGALPLGVFVNISPRELSEPGLASYVTETLDRHGLSNHDLALELTERAFIDEADPTVRENLGALIERGIRLVLDDFGTGYSALASLKRFPLAAVKIDRYFINAIHEADAAAPITRAVITLGHALGLTVIAEGIEEQVQLDVLAGLGCDAAQGFLLGRPQRSAEISMLLSSEPPPDEPAGGVLALAGDERRYRDLFERAAEAVFTADLAGNFTSVNPGAERITGFTRDELLALNFFDLIAPAERERSEALMERAFSGEPEVRAELELVVKGDRRVFVEVSGRLVTTDDAPLYLEGIVRETTERHQLEEWLRHRSMHDELTGLPNRSLLNDRLNQALARGERDGSDVVVMLLDLDDFKPVNDTLGHEAGDMLLVEVASRLEQSLRRGETVARIGGDEFALVAGDVRGRDDAVAVAERVLAVFVEPFKLGDTVRHMTGSLGVTISTGEGVSASDLLRDADSAMYRVKLTRKGGFALFDSGSDGRSAESPLPDSSFA